MKRNLLSYLFLAPLILLGWPVNSFAQKADTVNVVASLPGDLYKFINGDTLANGQRTNPNRVYRLERGKIYVVDAVMYFRYNVTMIADDDNQNSPKCPPILVNGKRPDGSDNLILISLMKNNIKVKFKNIFFQGVSTTRTEESDNQAIAMGGDSIRLIVDNCVFNALGMQDVVMWGKNNKIYLTNNIFRNGVRAHPFKGQIISNSGALDQDTIVMTNNTSFNNNSYFWAALQDIVKYEKIEHNTIYMSIVNVLYMPWMVNTIIRDNLFYGTLSYGQKQTEVDGGWYDFNKSLSSIISITKGSSFIFSQHGLEESDRKINVSNNAYFWPQKVKDNWASNNLIYSDIWMNARTLGFFSDKTNYPNLTNENNLSVDPQFNSNMEETVVDSVVHWVNNMRLNNKSTYRNYNVGSTDLLRPIWPLPENLAYANTQLQTAGHDGLPVGDLNWFPEAKKKWEAMNNGTTSVQANIKTDEEVLQLSYSPNPARQNICFSFKLDKSGNSVLRVFNLQGKQVATIVNAKLEKGIHYYNFNVSNLPNGVYICQLSSGNFTSQGKMIVSK